MKTKSISLSTILLSLILAASCNSNTERSKGDNDSTKNDTTLQSTKIIQAGHSDPLQILKNLLNQKPLKDSLNGDVDLGQEVKIDSAMLCINMFRPDMKKYAIEDPAGIISLRIRKSRQITDWEEFGGVELVEWLLKIVQNLDPDGQGVNIGIRIEFGVYTDAFLNTYLPGQPDLIAKKKGRIAVFLVPYSKITNKLLLDDNSSAFDFGGLKP